ncbi:MAG: alpha-amylase [Bacteroidales bacterium]|nr:alpha-amylase [Bacteroidales bacterium]
MEQKFIIYQLLLRVFGNTNENCVSNGSLSFNGTGKFSSITDEVFEHLHSLGASHIWYTGVIEHATKESFEEYGIKKEDPSVVKGAAGSPYAIKDYYDVNPYLADSVPDRMAEFEDLVLRTHNAGFKVVLDFVPNHLAREYNSDSIPFWGREFGIGDNPNIFSQQNNFYYLPGEMFSMGTYNERPARATGNDCFTAHPTQNDWYETVKLNYGVDYMGGRTKHFFPIPKTWYMMNEILCFWASKGIDAFRCDMAELVPVEFWEWCIKDVKQKYPKVQFIAEVYNPAEYNSYLYRGGFDYLYDKVGLYDTLKSVAQGHSAYALNGGWGAPPASSITGCWQSVNDFQNRMLNFLENHDEQRIASDFNLYDPFRAIPSLAVSLMLNKAPFMIYCGQEVGERGMLQEGFSGRDGRTSIFDWCSAPSIVRMHKGKLNEDEAELLETYREMLSFAMGCSAITKGDTYDLQYANFNNPAFDTDKCFVFARKWDGGTDSFHRGGNILANGGSFVDKKELVIVVADFSQRYESAKVNLPEEFFRYWQIPYGLLNPYEQLEVKFNKYGVAILRFEL